MLGDISLHWAVLRGNRRHWATVGDGGRRWATVGDIGPQSRPNMDDKNHSSASMAAAIDSPSGESSRENAKQDINAALSNIDNKMGEVD